MRHEPSAWVWLYPIVLPIAILFLIGWIIGWSALARRFRAVEPFCGETWGRQSARFRWGCSYNNCLTFGANEEGLYLAVMLPFRLFYPPLLIPWREIEVETGKELFGLNDTATFRVGTEERVTMKIYGKLVDRLRQAAGPSWPLYYQEQMVGR